MKKRIELSPYSNKINISYRYKNGVKMNFCLYIDVEESRINNNTKHRTILMSNKYELIFE